MHDTCSMWFVVGVMAFVILKAGVEIEDRDIIDTLKDLVKKKIAAFAVPTAFLVSLLYTSHIYFQ